MNSVVLALALFLTFVGCGVLNIQGVWDIFDFGAIASAVCLGWLALFGNRENF